METSEIIPVENGVVFILESIIEKSGLTMSQVAEKSNIPQPRFSEWLNGKRVPKWTTLQEIAQSVGVKVIVEVHNDD